MKKVIALLLVVIMCGVVLVGCKNNPKDDRVQQETTLVVGYSNFNSKFSPFFSETAYDQDVAAMTSLGLLSSDRMGAIIYKGIKGETIAYNGTDYTYYGPADLEITTDEATGEVYYDFTLREDIKFSDGEPLTVDDVIFSMYVLSDPTYDGSSVFSSLPIKGMTEYRSGMDSRGNLIFAAGKDGYTATEYFTEAQYNAFWEYYNNKAGIDMAQEIVDYCISNGYGTDVTSAAAAWGFELAEGATVEDFWKAIYEAYDGDIETAASVESAGTSLLTFTINGLGSEYQAGVNTGDSAANIAGIQKTGKNTLRVVLTEVDATAIYQLGVTITPLHYYGEKAKYDYDANKFGFDKGDLSSVRKKTTVPMGAGPYKFVKFENGVVSFEANNNYYLGKPLTKYVQFKEATDEQKLNGVLQGTLDISDPSFNTTTVEAVKKANNNGTLYGDKVTISAVNNLGYGYVGQCANRVCVGNDPASEASKNLRKAIATIISVYRDVSVSSYYGERASVINYPISDTSWAAPQVTDEGYKVAFSTDVNGNPIYTSDMDLNAKVEAAKKAALGFLEAAGYTVTDNVVTAAPEGGKTEFEALIPADGTGDHPTFYCLTEASKALEAIGIKLIVTDLANSDELWDKLEANQVDIWAAAWGATVDPDMYQIYFSGEEGKEAGGSNYMYKIADSELNQLILDARKSLDQNYRKTLYKECLDIIVGWGVEIPIYQRQNVIIFSPERVDMNTVTPDITTFYGWMAEIQDLQMVTAE